MTSTNGVVKRDTRRFKFIRFSINNLLGYFEQLTNAKTHDQIIELVRKMTK